LVCKWDARTYNGISTVQERWGHRVIESRHWIDNDVVMDAGCGTGRVSKFIAEKVHSAVV
jgi:ubiquinone/menaquinone biosynthesis C-methylase UbiE